MRRRFVAEIHDVNHQVLATTGDDHANVTSALSAASELARTTTGAHFLVTFRIIGQRRERLGVATIRGRGV